MTDTPNDVPRTMFEHNVWANLKLIDACAALDTSALANKDPGAFGSIQETLVHIINGERYYLWLLGGSIGPRAARLPNDLPLAALRAEADASGRQLLALSASPGSIADNATDDPERPVSAAMLFTQAIHHGNEHRTNVTTTLAKIGAPECDVSVWAWWSQRA
jgi:uncharacterized damage-inducible protein DinB